MILADAPPPVWPSGAEFPAEGLPGTSAAPVLTVGADGAFFLAWEQRAGGESDVVVRRREPGPPGWVEPACRADTDTPGASRSIEPRVAAGPDGLVLVAWQDDRGGADHIRVNRSTDGGRSFGPEDVAPDVRRRESSEAPGPATMPALAVDGDGRAYVAWEDRTSGERDIYCARSLDGGASWEAPLRVDSDSAGTGISYHPQIVAWAGGTMIVCWWDERAGLADVYVRRSTDAGGSWVGPESRLDPGGPGRAPSQEVCVERRGESVTLTWYEGRESAAHGAARRVASRTSKDRGAHWSTLASSWRRSERVAATSAIGETLSVRVKDSVLVAEWRCRR